MTKDRFITGIYNYCDYHTVLIPAKLGRAVNGILERDVSPSRIRRR